MSYTAGAIMRVNMRQHGAEAGVGARVLEDVEAVGARRLPSRSPPIVTVWSWARPCTIPVMFSERVSLHRTGRPTCFASHATSANSGSAPILAPKPPPTSGAITRTCSASMPSQPGDLVARGLRVLRGAPEGDAAVLAPLGGGGAGLQRGRGEPLVDQLPRDDDLAAVEEVRVEVLLVVEAVGGVGARLGEEQHLVGGGGLEVDDDRQRVVVDLDQVGGVLALVGLLGEDGGHRLADEPHHVLRQERAHHLLVGPAEQQRGLEVDVGAGEDARRRRAPNGPPRRRSPRCGRGRGGTGRA